MSKLTEEQAIKLADSEFYKDMSFTEIAKFQLFQPRLCMPFSVFHEALEKTLGRPVFTHELGLSLPEIKKELLGNKAAPTFDELINLIPKDKLIGIIT